MGGNDAGRGEWLWSLRRRRWPRRAMVGLAGAWVATIIAMAPTWTIIYGEPEEEQAMRIASFVREHSDADHWVVLHGMNWLLVALGVTAAIAAASFVLAPGTWFDWPLRLATTSPEIFPLPPLWIRLMAAGLIAGVGGHFTARWTLPLAAVLAQLVFWFTGFAVFFAWFGLIRHRRMIASP